MPPAMRLQPEQPIDFGSVPTLRGPAELHVHFQTEAAQEAALQYQPSHRNAGPDLSSAEVLLRGPEGVDTIWYRGTYPDIGPDLDPVSHYLATGWREGRRPNASFSAAWYLRLYFDVASSGVEPLSHFLERGRSEARLSAPRETTSVLDFLDRNGGVDTQWYRARYPELGPVSTPLLTTLWRGGARDEIQVRSSQRTGISSAIPTSPTPA
jgi:hypothetical protein